MSSHDVLPMSDAELGFIRSHCGPVHEAVKRMQTCCARARQAAVLLKNPEDGKEPPSYLHSFIAKGSESAVFRYYSASDKRVQFAVKFDLAKPWAFQPSVPKPVKDIHGPEIEAAFLVWYMLHARGLSAHVPNIFGVMPFLFDESAMPYCSERPRQRVNGLVMEFTEGIQFGDSRVHTLYELLARGRRNQVVDESGTDVFDEVLRAVVFQVLFTVAAWTVCTHTGFRHNDLHCGNVCLSYWRSDKKAVDVEYRLPLANGVERVFKLCTPYCAVIVDFGYAALLPHAGGTPYDSRFYCLNRIAATEPLKRSATASNGLLETRFKEWGLSHIQPSRHYDSCLFAFAVLHGIVRSAHPASKAYQAFHQRCFGTVYSSKNMFKRQAAGRLTPAAQVRLMSVGTLPVNRREFRVLDAFEVLEDEYFTPFRISTLEPAGVLCFGSKPSKDVVMASVPLQVVPRQHFKMACKPEDATAWKCVLDDKGNVVNLPRMLPWTHLKFHLDKQLSDSISTLRSMTSTESDQWCLHSAVAVKATDHACDTDTGDFDFMTSEPIGDL